MTPFDHMIKMALKAVQQFLSFQGLNFEDEESLERSATEAVKRVEWSQLVWQQAVIAKKCGISVPQLISFTDMPPNKGPRQAA